MKVGYMDRIPDFALGRKYERYKIEDQIEVFCNSPKPVMTLEWEPGDGYKNAETLRNTYDNAVKRMEKQIIVTKRGNIVYLVKIPSKAEK